MRGMHCLKLMWPFFIPGVWLFHLSGTWIHISLVAYGFTSSANAELLL